MWIMLLVVLGFLVYVLDRSSIFLDKNVLITTPIKNTQEVQEDELIALYRSPKKTMSISDNKDQALVFWGIKRIYQVKDKVSFFVHVKDPQLLLSDHIKAFVYFNQIYKIKELSFEATRKKNIYIASILAKDLLNKTSMWGLYKFKVHSIIPDKEDQLSSLTFDFFITDPQAVLTTRIKHQFDENDLKLMIETEVMEEDDYLLQGSIYTKKDKLFGNFSKSMTLKKGIKWIEIKLDNKEFEKAEMKLKYLSISRLTNPVMLGQRYLVNYMISMP